MNKTEIFNQLRGGLIVSCQALETEPLHSSFIMGRMARAALEGGAVGIRANTVEDIAEIKSTVSLPVIGIIKKVYSDCPVFITPTEREVEALVRAGAEIIALDATDRLRPDGKTLEETFAPLRRAYPDQLFMADCAAFQEAKRAENLGFDLAGTTLCGYTENTKGVAIPNMELIRQMGAELRIPVIAEGGIWEPEQLHKILRLQGVLAAVVGTAITRPREITRRFVQAI